VEKPRTAYRLENGDVVKDAALDNLGCYEEAQIAFKKASELNIKPKGIFLHPVH